MATLVLTAVGTAIGGPLGGAIGSLVGSQIDGALFGPADREGPRLQELSVTTSSYGTAVPRHFGTMRAAGSIIWGTELIESSEETGAGKGKPSVTTYSYSTSFAVAISSRPVASIGRIWADGNLLRGRGGDLKVGGAFRFYSGHGNQLPDPLIAADKGAACPAFRGLAYCVFEDLQLADFGNRIPALTFEVVADTGEVSLQSIVNGTETQEAGQRLLPNLQGFSDTGGSMQAVLNSIHRVYPLTCDANGASLAFRDGHPAGEPVAELPEAAVASSQDAFGSRTGQASQRRADTANVPNGLRYYDIDRDYQAGLQRAGGRALSGRSRILEFPGALAAGNARKLADDAAERASWSQERLAYRVAQLDPSLGPGQIVSVPGRPGKWRIEAWEWRETGLELELLRLPSLRGTTVVSDAGASLAPRDAVASPTLLTAYELPWDGLGSSDQRQVFAAASSASAGWTGATLYADHLGSLVPIGGTGTRRSVTGETTAPLPASACMFIDRQAALLVQLDSQDFQLSSATPEALAGGANRVLVGEEVLQFGKAENLGSGRWRISDLLRGRGGTEHIATQAAPAGLHFVLLDGKAIALEASEAAEISNVAAIGLADPEAVVAPIISAGRTRTPLMPVHGEAIYREDGALHLRWRRRARGAWTWPDTVDVPLNEQFERYEVGIGPKDQPDMAWEALEPSMTIAPALYSQIKADFAGRDIWVRQVGSHGRSPALLLVIIN